MHKELKSAVAIRLHCINQASIPPQGSPRVSDSSARISNQYMLWQALSSLSLFSSVPITSLMSESPLQMCVVAITYSRCGLAHRRSQRMPEISLKRHLRRPLPQPLSQPWVGLSEELLRSRPDARLPIPSGRMGAGRPTKRSKRDVPSLRSTLRSLTLSIAVRRKIKAHST
eukprot:900564-Pleurochrysis_carterae.AAC.3